MVLQRGLDVLEEGDGKAVALVDVWDVAVEAGFGVVVGEEADVGEFPAEDVDEEDDGFGRGGALGLGDIGVEAADGVFAAFGRAAVDGAADAAGGHADAGGHFGELVG